MLTLIPNFKSMSGRNNRNGEKMYSHYDIVQSGDGWYHVWHVSVPNSPGITVASFRSYEDARMYVDLKGTALNNNAIRKKLGVRVNASV